MGGNLARPRERWLLTGGAGQLGGYVARTLEVRRPQAEVISLPGPSTKSMSRRIDVTDLPMLQEFVESFRPTHIVHLAGNSSPGVAQAAPRDTERRERGPVEYFAEYAQRNGAWFFLPSTDFVWSGDDIAHRYTEDDVPRPINTYGLIKLGTEQIVLDAEVGMVARCSLMYGRPIIPRQTTWTRIAESLATNQMVTACVDEYRSPLSLADAASVVVELGGIRYQGLMHLAGPESLTAEDMIRRLASHLGVEPLLNRVSRIGLTPGVTRPGNVAMDCKRLRDTAPEFLPREMGPKTITEVFGPSQPVRSSVPH